MSTETTALRDRLASIVNAMGYEFVGCELQRQGQGHLLRIYLDAENGITLDQCAKVSRQLSAMLDVEEPIQGKYTLEVSSPGIDRPLFEIAHYQKYIGSEIKVRIKMPIDNRRHFSGTLLRVEGTDIHLLVDSQEITLPFSVIDKAKLIANCW